MKIVCICEDEAPGNCVGSGLIQDHEISIPEINSKAIAELIIIKHRPDLL